VCCGSTVSLAAGAAIATATSLTTVPLATAPLATASAALDFSSATRASTESVVV
tara:strand:+ start:4364 stop:4525 length:162 start_codon:yes stop_codon:yes gene_type:complete